MAMAHRSAVIHYCEADDIRALRSALEDWQSALQAFDNAEGALYSELAAIRLDEAARRYGRLSREGAVINGLSDMRQ